MTNSILLRGILCGLLTASTIFAQAQNQPSPPAVVSEANTPYAQALAAARAALDSANYDQAVNQATEALKARPGDKAATDLLTLALLRKTTLQSPNKSQVQSPAPESASYDNALAAARVAMERRDYDAAIRQANEALRQRPADETANLLIAQ